MLRSYVIAPPAQPLFSGGQTDSEVRTSQTWHWRSPPLSPTALTPSFPGQIQAARTQPNAAQLSSVL